MKIAALLFLGACCCGDWGLGTGIKPVPVDDTKWHDTVSEAVSIWNITLELCGTAFYIDKVHGREAVLTDGKGWPDDRSGYYDHERIYILRELSLNGRLAVTLHELGHGLGYDHVDPEDDPSSIMNPTVSSLSRPTERDKRIGMEMFGCQ